MDTNQFAFAPWIDLPLLVGTVIVLICHCHRWAKSAHLDSDGDLTQRLPAARVRVVALFTILLLICWLSNLAVWFCFALLIGFGIVIALFSAVDVLGGTVLLFASAYVIREWAFGFPQLILSPPKRSRRREPMRSHHEPLIGKTGIVAAPLRPMGLVEIDGTEVAASSADGQIIDAGTEVIVTAFQNGSHLVRPTTAK